MAAALDARLPEGFRAAPIVQQAIEIDVATAGAGSTGTTVEEWQPSAGTGTFPFELAGEAAEVVVYGHRDGRYLAAAIELASVGNKDRPEAREAFAAGALTFAIGPAFKGN